MPSRLLPALTALLVALAACAADPATPAAGGDTHLADAPRSDAADPIDTNDTNDTNDPIGPGDPETGFYLPPEPQRDGDPALGFAILAEGAYVGCGIPSSLIPIAERAGFFGAAPPLPGRDDPLPYYLSRFTVASGVEVVGPNCFACHAGFVDGELIVGAPASGLDYGAFASQIDGFAAQVASLRGLLQPEDYAELERFAERMSAIAPYVQTEVATVNPADNLAAILFAHRDPETMAWHEEPLLEPPPTYVVPVDVPPWWRMGKRHSMFYTAAGRGDHARIMMAASILCVDDAAEAARIDEGFGHVRAYLASLTPPAWPWGVDEALAAEGQAIFEANCARCHGTYGEDASYPNRWFPVETVGTDPVLAVGASQFAERFVDWFNASFFGEVSVLDPKTGYVAPPLDGIWASPPYLHNGSVPTVWQVLDSASRPTFWRRRAQDGSDYDRERVGWRHEVLDFGHADIPSPSARRTLYDTTLLGYGSGGHTFGDHLTEDERRAVVEYLKTL